MNDNPSRFHSAHLRRWTVRENRRHKAWCWEIINHLHDVVAVVYGSRDDAELMASTSQQRAAAQELQACTRRLATILGRFQERLAPSELMALNRARELTAW